MSTYLKKRRMIKRILDWGRNSTSEKKRRMIRRILDWARRFDDKITDPKVKTQMAAVAAGLKKFDAELKKLMTLGTKREKINTSLKAFDKSLEEAKTGKKRINAQTGEKIVAALGDFGNEMTKYVDDIREKTYNINLALKRLKV